LNIVITADNGKVTLDWFEIGNFIRMDEKNYVLQYLANESQEKLWPGKNY
jgi:hypothetical protein